MARYSPRGWMLRLAVEHGVNFLDCHYRPTTKAAAVEDLRFTAEREHEWSAREDPHARHPSRQGDQFWIVTDVRCDRRRYHFEAPPREALRRLREREILERASSRAAKSPTAPGKTPSPARRMRL